MELKRLVSRKGAKTQRKDAELRMVNTLNSLSVLLCVFAPLRETSLSKPR